MRYFVERSNQDAISELGWDEFQAQKYRAWQHEVAMMVPASWFIAHAKLDWAQTSARDPELAHHFEVDVLPRLSTANIRERLRARLPLPQLTPKEAMELVIEPLLNRTRSRASRLRKVAMHSLRATMGDMQRMERSGDEATNAEKLPTEGKRALFRQTQGPFNTRLEYISMPLGGGDCHDHLTSVKIFMTRR